MPDVNVTRLSHIRRVDELGRIVLPAESRERLDIKDGDAVEVLDTKDGVLVRKMGGACDKKK